MARVKTRVFVRGEEGREAVLNPGDTVPDWAEVTNPDALLSEDESEVAETETETETEEPAAPAQPRKRAPRKKAATPAAEVETPEVETAE